jgi:hypothetical protein
VIPTDFLTVAIIKPILSNLLLTALLFIFTKNNSAKYLCGKAIIATIHVISLAIFTLQKYKKQQDEFLRSITKA